MNFFLALASAALLVLSFPGLNLFWLAPVALAPIIVAAAQEQRKFRRFWTGYAAGVVYWFTACNWIQWTIETHGGITRAAAWFCFALFCLAKAAQMGVFTLLAGWTMRSRMAVPATAALWVLIEYSHAPLGFAWLQLGNAAVDMGLPLRLAPFTGVWGITFLFAAVAAELANLFLKRPGIPGLALALTVSVFFLPALPAELNPTEKAVLVQPNIDETQQWTPEALNLLLKRMSELSFAPLAATAQSASGSGPKNAPQPQLLIWPEARRLSMTAIKAS